jgi:hypothetical protein
MPRVMNTMHERRSASDHGKATGGRKTVTPRMAGGSRMPDAQSLLRIREKCETPSSGSSNVRIKLVIEASWSMGVTVVLVRRLANILRTPTR